MDNILLALKPLSEAKRMEYVLTVWYHCHLIAILKVAETYHAFIDFIKLLALGIEIELSKD